MAGCSVYLLWRSKGKTPFLETTSYEMPSPREGATTRPGIAKSEGIFFNS